MVEKELFLSQIFEMEVLMDLHVMKSLESENYIFNVWSVCMYVCMSAVSITQKTNHSRNIKFGILHLCNVQMLLETFYKDRTKIL